MIHGAVNQKASFDPATAKRAFTVGMTDIGEVYFRPALMEELAKVVPGVTTSTLHNTAVNLRDEMEAGHIDLANGLRPQLEGGLLPALAAFVAVGHILHDSDMVATTLHCIAECAVTFRPAAPPPG
jgi:hypothetical protein